VSSIYGLGENIVQGKVNPDEFFVFKPTGAIIYRAIGQKKIKMIYNPSKLATSPVKDVPVPVKDQTVASIDDAQVKQLAKWGMIIEKHYKRPMDIEWALDGHDHKLYIVQARPETIHSVRDYSVVEEYRLEKRGKILVEGRSVGNKIGAGKVRKIMSVKDIKQFKKGEVLLTDMTDPDWEPIMKIASAIITDKGGRTCFSGNTKVLTNRGFFEMRQITQDLIASGLYTPALNRDNLKIEWKQITDVMSRKSKTMKINVSQTGRHQDNYLSVTPDHKFIVWNNRTLIDKEIGKIIKDQDMLVSVDKINSFKAEKISKELAYLWGCIYTDGSIYLSRNHGEVQFIQKPTREKEQLIKTVNQYFYQIFGKKLAISEKKETNGMIRGKSIVGSANAYRCYSKDIAEKFIKWKSELALNMLNCDSKINLYFLAGVIDGDGTFNAKNNRINIFCLKEDLLQAIVISCLKLNILPQVTNNRTIYNVQIVDEVNKLIQCTQRIKGESKRVINGTKFLAGRQILGDIVDLVNWNGRIKPYVNNNLLIDKNKISTAVLPLLKGEIKRIVQNIIKSPLVSVRATGVNGSKTEEVFNLTVEDHHNYLVFSSKYMPILVNNCHAAIVSRELGIPCVVGTENATKQVQDKSNVTVSCAEGDEGYVYEGILKYRVNKDSIKDLERPNTKIMMNIGSPDMAFAASFIPNDGVGLAREEFIINNYIKIHPLALLNFDKLEDKKAKKQIEEITKGWTDKSQFFVDKLAEGVGMIAAAFYPKDVIARLSDFKTNEYANLIGGSAYEPVESNPMIGWRGASRYYDPRYQAAFKLECKALKKVRDEFGLKNLKIMIPICRTVEEGKKVLAIMAANGLVQHHGGLEIYVMAEIPVNMILADDFAKVFDGFSIGSNDLTQFTLGIDRDAGDLHVAGPSNEKNEAVKTLIKFLIKAAKKRHRKVGICGQAPSDFPDFARFLVDCGIDSISLNPDTVIKTTIDLAKYEKKLKHK
jgi:pyruvate,water dikinase